MGTSSEEFVNVGALDAMVVTSAGGLARWIQDNVLAPLRTASATGVPRVSVLFFPPNRESWVLTGVPWPLVLPPEVEVQIAPGARVVPKGRAALLVIEGPLVAPVAQIFEVPDADLTRPDGIGRVQLLGDRQRLVHPEWWGAGLGSPAVDSAALQEAVFVALDRPEPLRVELLGRYVLRRSLLLRDRRVVFFTAPGGIALPAPPGGGQEPAGLELRGRMNPAGATIQCGADFEGDVMLAVDAGAPAVTLHAVSLDARGRAARCVGFELPSSDAGQVTRAAHVLRHCTLEGASVALLSVTRPEAQSGAAAVVTRVPLLDVNACTFSPTHGTVGARLAGPHGSVVAFRGCTFAGEALAMIHVLGQGVVATSCRFDNRQVPQKLRTARPLWDELHRAAPEGGVDICLDQERRFFVRLQPYSFLGPRVLLASEEYDLPGWVSAQDCRSSSLQFLVANWVPRAQVPGGVRDSVVIGLHHTCDPTPLMLARDQLPPAVQWWIAPSTGCALTIMGCRFDGLTGATASRVTAFGDHANDAARPPLFEYGTCSADRVIRTPTDGTTPNSDVFSAADPGRVPYLPYR